MNCNKLLIVLALILLPMFYSTCIFCCIWALRILNGDSLSFVILLTRNDNCLSFIRREKKPQEYVNKFISAFFSRIIHYSYLSRRTEIQKYLISFVKVNLLFACFCPVLFCLFVCLATMIRCIMFERNKRVLVLHITIIPYDHTERTTSYLKFNYLYLKDTLGFESITIVQITKRQVHSKYNICIKYLLNY